MLLEAQMNRRDFLGLAAASAVAPVSYTHLTLPTN